MLASRSRRQRRPGPPARTTCSYSVTRQRDTGKAEVTRPDRDFQGATSPDPATDASRNCTPGYSPCLPLASDYDCRGGSGNGPKYSGPVRVTGSDPYDLDRDGDGDGKACEWS